ncbi:hypothetical protein J2W28_006955 [Variovorax boronicumulans]|uniref:hypothetical protein n=1 Tax=Variovorax boronicumulans TaxID=436515 RepID=UPI002785F064|nr:hypothetical protein [Variovorax boronicumulans]MDP9996466.1 hypothetical protein [Variovorax boronicumulans]MDQ0007776.1 hypothetical protein [Variovorax boronicumulans]
MARSTQAGMRVQRYHSALDIGNALTTRSRRQEPVSVHIRQSEADGACAMHCVAMALVILDLAKRSAILSMAHRKYGVAADLYEALGHSWHEGAYAQDVVDALEALELPITVRWADGFDRGVDAFAADSLKKAQLTMLAYESAKDRHRHFVLGVGCGGQMVGQKLAVDSLLVLDPSADALPFTCCNGMLSIDKPVAFEKRRTSVQWQYASAGQTEPVRLMSAISIVRHDGVLGRGGRYGRST